MDDWKLITDRHPTVGRVVLTKIDDGKGERNYSGTQARRHERAHVADP
jgi:hypothetical protein